MPSTNPRIPIVASQERIDVWKDAAKGSGRSFNLWAGDALDAAAATDPTGKKVVAAAKRQVATAQANSFPPQPRGRKGVCARERFHRPGQFCKTCGATPA